MSSAPQILVVAGEASGDAHAAELVAALKARRPDLTFFGMGGARLAAQGVELLYGAHEVNVMGITEVLPKIPRILQVMGGLSRAAAARRPACAILVDIPDFNLRLAARLKKLGVPIAYYVSPMIWAWRRGRVKTIARLVDRMLCILPFEEAFYREAGVAARYVGSPVVEQVPAPASAATFRQKLGLPTDAPTLALLPGSRMSEIRRILPTLVGAARRLVDERPGLQVVVPVAPTIAREEILSRFAGSGVTPVLVEGRAPEVVGASDAAIVASGTAALEAGLMQRPLVVVYRVSFLTYLVGRLMLKVAHVALVNLLAERRVVPELLQGQMTPERIAAEIRRLWVPGAPREEMLQGLEEVRSRLGETGAAERAAETVLELLPPATPLRATGG
ncbi:lipid-A-disaccharide synthase [Melittangium boletus]|uniref:lipid-A-disaccharide synthase n=1 Tax=Melittangium boletus TaxID=83453 RepID=UPI003DA2F3D3